MICFYTGTPGSGKSYHATQRIDINLRRKVNVIANFVIKTNYRHRGMFVFKDNLELTPDFLIEFALEHHDLEHGKEHQTLVVIDEASIIFNSRGFDIKQRMKWLQFLSLHRQYGYDIILITQSDRAIDRQVRGLVEYNYKHRVLSGFGLKGWFLIALLRKKFVSVKYWYVIDEKCEAYFFNVKKKIADLYDTFGMAKAILADKNKDKPEAEQGKGEKPKKEKVSVY